MAASGSLLRKYVAAFAVLVGVPLLAYGAIGAWFAWNEHRAALAEIQRGHASAAAVRIGLYLRELEGQLGWATQLPWTDDNREQHLFDARRLLRQVPAVTDLTLIDGQGREQLTVSRLSLDRPTSGADRSRDPLFVAALNERVHYGEVYFRRQTEPFMTLSTAGTRRDNGVAIAEVNLKHIWDVVARIRVGKSGVAYVVDGRGRLIAHPDISLVLRNTALPAHLAAVAQRATGSDDSSAPIVRTTGLQGADVLATGAAVPPLDWRVLVELPVAEADQPLFAALARALALAAAGLALAIGGAVLLAWRMASPVRALTAGAARIGSGHLDHRIDIATGDELQALGAQFNAMAAALQASYADLERKVESRTHELAEANRSKARFLAAASHDLRQPLHALNLLVAQLRGERDPIEHVRLTGRIERAIAAMNRLFSGLLDISKLDADVVDVQAVDFPVAPMLRRIEEGFADDAAAKGLRLRVAPSTAWVRSDPALLERVTINLVANAVRYTDRGGVVVGFRRAGDALRLHVIDSGIGIPVERQRQVFSEFYRIAPADAARGEGLGLGLAIVERLCGLMGHPLALCSAPGEGTRFVVTLPRAAARIAPVASTPLPNLPQGLLRGRRIVVVDNDPAVLQSTAGLLGSWGCDVVAATSADDALARLSDRAPDLVVADYHLDAGLDGLEAIAALRARFGVGLPAFLVTGDVTSGPRERAAAHGLHLLEKPIGPMALRALLTSLLSAAAPSRCATPAAPLPSGSGPAAPEGSPTRGS